MAKPKIHYENGNIHTPVIVVGEDESTADEDGNAKNLLVVRLGAAVSVPKETISEKEGTPGEDEEGNG